MEDVLDGIKGIKMTKYSHGAGCGCKISPKDLTSILKTQITQVGTDNLIVGNDTRDDAAVYDIGNGQGIISTTDFFLPIVDDPFKFGKIAAANAISDIYAMGGKPLMAIAILGWPVNKLSNEVANSVLEGGRAICKEAGIPLAGGHSIDNPEPIFGLAVTGIVDLDKLKRNDQAESGSVLFLTKPLGVGILATAQKNGTIKPEHADIAPDSMMKLNNVGDRLSRIDGITAMTDVTGFGLLGHLLEVCEGSGLSAELYSDKIPVFDPVEEYIDLGNIPGGTKRNWESYGDKVSIISGDTKLQNILCDAQTSGGLLIAVKEEMVEKVKSILIEEGLYSESIGKLNTYNGGKHIIVK
ncbi:MAG: selenide, water dikinase SelD [Flavobacteriales bacterium]|nr:selenide, water dikinase SelD [Flavobacteriales bacterium]